MLFLVEVSEHRVYSAEIDAPSIADARRIAQERAKAGEMEMLTRDIETSAFRSEYCPACEGEHFDACPKPAQSELLQPSWKRAQL